MHFLVTCGPLWFLFAPGSLFLWGHLLCPSFPLFSISVVPLHQPPSFFYLFPLGISFSPFRLRLKTKLQKSLAEAGERPCGISHYTKDRTFLFPGFHILSGAPVDLSSADFHTSSWLLRWTNFFMYHQGNKTYSENDSIGFPFYFTGNKIAELLTERAPTYLNHKQHQGRGSLPLIL